MGELASSTALKQANVSQHLALMRHRMIVVERRVGNTVFYRISDRRINEACDIMQQVLLTQVARTRSWLGWRSRPVAKKGDEKMQTLEQKIATPLKRNRLVIICSKGSLDMAYPPLMLATTGAAMGMDVHLYFTFWGMNMITKKTVDSLKISRRKPSSTNAEHSWNDSWDERHGDLNDDKENAENEDAQHQRNDSYCKESGVKFHACSPQ